MHAFTRKTVLVSALAVGFTATLVAGAGPAGATVSPQAVPTGDSAVSAQTAREVNELIRLNPGARQVGPASVELQKGLVATKAPARPGDVHTMGVPTKCDSGYVCMYDNAQDAWNGGGWVLGAYNCGKFNLGNLAHPMGGKWNDRISAVFNNQTGGASTAFYNFDGRFTWGVVAGQDSGHYLLNLADLNKDNIIDGIDVCSSLYDPNWQPNTPVSRWSGYNRQM
jgi:hypothetical protein